MLSMAPADAAPSDCDYYQVLGLPFEASEEDIRKEYHKIVRTLHPDRRRPGSSGGHSLERFHQVQSAWRVLSVPTRRLLYDLRNFGHSSLSTGKDEPEGHLLELQKQQAARDMENMQIHLQTVLRREEVARGVIVRYGLYGDLRLRPERLKECSCGNRQIQADDLLGPLLDVTAPLQSFVEKHSLVLPGGVRTSKADLQGFYNPAPFDPNVELSLYVLYEFRQQLHEVLVGDREQLRVPMRKHAIGAGEVPRGPFCPSNVAALATKGFEQAGSGRRRGGAAGSCRASEVEALAQAVRSHMICRLSPPVSRPPDRWEVSKVEFWVVLLLSGVALAAGVTLARKSD